MASNVLCDWLEVSVHFMNVTPMVMVRIKKTADIIRAKSGKIWKVKLTIV